MEASAVEDADKHKQTRRLVWNSLKAIGVWAEQRVIREALSHESSQSAAGSHGQASLRDDAVPLKWPPVQNYCVCVCEISLFMLFPWCILHFVLNTRVITFVIFHPLLVFPAVLLSFPPHCRPPPPHTHRLAASEFTQDSTRVWQNLETFESLSRVATMVLVASQVNLSCELPTKTWLNPLF